MSAVYCGTKRSYFEDIPSPPSSKRFRCYSPSNSPTWSSPSSSFDQLRSAFPNLQLTVLVKALEEHGSDLNAAMKSLYSLVSVEEKQAETLASEGANEEIDTAAGGTFTDPENPPTSGYYWVELLVREVTQSTGTDDAKVRVARVLEALEKKISAHAREETGQKFQEVRLEHILEIISLICKASNTEKPSMIQDNLFIGGVLAARSVYTL